MERNWKSLFLLFVFCPLVSSQISTFSNPILDIAERDVSVVKIDNFYYLIHADRSANGLRILKSPFLTNFRNAESALIYEPPPGHNSFYLSSILQHNNELYVYIHMAGPNAPDRMFVLRANDPKNPMSSWGIPNRVLDHIWSYRSSQGTVLKLNRELYFVWNSQSEAGSGKGLYIAKMENPTKAVAPVVLLREPALDWECNGGCSLEGPAVLYNRDKVYLVFSASAWSHPESCISYMSIQIGQDPLISTNWQSASGPVFQSNPEENVYSTRLPGFTASPDGTETWMVYTASSNASDVIPTSAVRIEKIEWDITEGFPKFPVARGNEFQYELPSGESSKFMNPIKNEVADDPGIYRVGNNYYLILSGSKQLVMYQSDKLYDFTNAQGVVIFSAAEDEDIVSVYAGRVSEINNELYIYVSMTSQSIGRHMYVIKAENKSDPMHNWGDPVRLLDGVFGPAVFGGTVMQHNSKLYFVWNNVTTNGHFIYIAPMPSPTEVTLPFFILKQPTHPWECQSVCINEWSFFLNREKITFMVFSNSSPGNADCSLSYMSIETDRDPMDPTSWSSTSGPAFTRNDNENVFSTCHAAFTTSPDGSETWVVYPGSSNATDIGSSRTIRIQKIDWSDETGHAVFPKAHGFTYHLSVPSTFEYFTNPIINASSVSPAIIRVGNFYYMMLSSDGESNLELWRSGKLEDFRNAERQIIFSVPDGYSIFGSSKMHILNSQLYIYFSMEGQDSTTNMYVIQAQDPSNPMGIWSTNPIVLAPSWEFPSSQSTVFEHGGNMYLVWISPHPATGFNSIFIAEMKNATHVVEPYNLIRHPTELWECDGGCSNEAPHFIYNEGSAYLVHSVGSACHGGDALTYLSIGKDKDPMNVVNWNKAAGKVFSENQEGSVFCPSHASFTFSPDGKENWMVYHATDSPHPDAVKTARIEKISWHLETGEPIFPEPHGLYHQQLVPGRKSSN